MALVPFALIMCQFIKVIVLKELWLRWWTLHACAADQWGASGVFTVGLLRVVFTATSVRGVFTVGAAIPWYSLYNYCTWCSLQDYCAMFTAVFTDLCGIYYGTALQYSLQDCYPCYSQRDRHHMLMSHLWDFNLCHIDREFSQYSRCIAGHCCWVCSWASINGVQTGLSLQLKLQRCCALDIMICML